MLSLVKSSLRAIGDLAKLYANYRHSASIGELVKAHFSFCDYDSIYLDWYFNHSKKLSKFKNIHQGEDCFIIGNGPSLNKMDLSPLRLYHTFGLNKIYLLFDKVDLGLSYHVAVNPYVIEQSAREFEKLSCQSFLSYRAAYQVIRPLHNINYIMTGGPHAFQTCLQNDISEGYTVTYVAMQIAFYMGFKRVFLVGVDHNFVAEGQPNELQLLEGDDLNHFTSDYFANKHWQLPDLEGSELSYHLARFFYNRHGRQIYDATVDGKLESFPKISYEEALRLCTKK